MDSGCDNVRQITIEELIGKHICVKCQNTYVQKSSLTRHLKDSECGGHLMSKTKDHFAKELADLKEMNKVMCTNMKKLTDSLIQLQSTGQLTPSINNNHLQVMCLGKEDNLLDILSSREGFPNALTYIKGCALARLAGDCRILEKAYKLETDHPAIMYANKSKTRYVYYDERRRRIVETNSKVMAKKLADILQRTYLKGMHSLRTDMLDQERENYVVPDGCNSEHLPELEPYDIQNWNAHIHELRDEKYQRKVLRSIRIPSESSIDGSESQ